MSTLPIIEVNFMIFFFIIGLEKYLEENKNVLYKLLFCGLLQYDSQGKEQVFLQVLNASSVNALQRFSYSYNVFSGMVFTELNTQRSYFVKHHLTITHCHSECQEQELPGLILEGKYCFCKLSQLLKPILKRAFKDHKC